MKNLVYNRVKEDLVGEPKYPFYMTDVCSCFITSFLKVHLKWHGCHFLFCIKDIFLI